MNGGIKQISAGVIGAGAWGRTFGQILIDGGWDVAIWSLYESEVSEISSGTTDLSKAVKGRDLIVIALPCSALRSVLPELQQYDLSQTTILSLTKGLEVETLLRPSQVIHEILGDVNLAALAGPNLAGELARKLPAVSIVASDNSEIARFLADHISNDYLQVHPSRDIVGLEVASVYKNILAIAIGLIRGAGRGQNLAAAVATAGLAEMCDTAVKFGGEPTTVYGPVGLGDLIATSSSNNSRNFSLGRLIAENGSVEQALDVAHQTVEGSDSAVSIVRLCENSNISTPITKVVADMLTGQLSVDQAIATLTKIALK